MKNLSRREFVVRAAGVAALPAVLSGCKDTALPSAAPGPSPPASGPAVAPVDWGFPEGAVRVGLNENPLGPSPRAIEAMSAALQEAHRYPLS